jgi:hypothetical protein
MLMMSYEKFLELYISVSFGHHCRAADFFESKESGPGD